MQEADRLPDLNHVSALDQIEQALNVLGMTLIVDVQAARNVWK